MSAISLTTIAVALLFFSIISVQAKPQHRHSLPRYVRLTLVGVKLKDAREDVVLFDPKSGYYLVEGSSDIGDRSLVLTPDLQKDNEGNAADMAEFQSHIRLTKFPRMRTGWGVNIGDTPRQVRQKLGMPQSTLHTRESVIQLEYVYQAQFGSL